MNQFKLVIGLLAALTVLMSLCTKASAQDYDDAMDDADPRSHSSGTRIFNDFCYRNPWHELCEGQPIGRGWNDNLYDPRPGGRYRCNLYPWGCKRRNVPYCLAHPNAPGCERWNRPKRAPWCEQHPDDPACRNWRAFRAPWCEQHPDDPACKNWRAFRAPWCEQHPDDPACKNWRVIDDYDDNDNPDNGSRDSIGNKFMHFG